MLLISALNTFYVPVHYGNKRPTSFYQTAYHGSPSSELQDAINTLCKEIKFKYPERNKSAAWREERVDRVSGPQTAIKRADVQQIVCRASCSTNVTSLSLVIISRSVGREIQIRLPEGRERKNSWTWNKKCTHCTRGGRTHDSLHTRDWRIYRSAQTGSEITIGEAVGSGGKSSVLSEDVFLFFPCSFSVDVMVFKTSVPWFHRWLFIVFVLDGCDDASYVELATTPESFITLSP